MGVSYICTDIDIDMYFSEAFVWPKSVHMVSVRYDLQIEAMFEKHFS